MTAAGRGVYDPGLQAERTLLAWRRTVLALAVVNAVGIRLTVASYGWTAVLIGGTGIAVAALVYLATGLRYRQVDRHLKGTDRHPGTGWPQVGTTAATLFVGAAAVLFILLPR